VDHVITMAKKTPTNQMVGGRKTFRVALPLSATRGKGSVLQVSGRRG
jgi:hypothetical protein